LSRLLLRSRVVALLIVVLSVGFVGGILVGKRIADVYAGVEVVSCPRHPRLAEHYAVGTVIGFVGPVGEVSAKWLPCDGRLLSRQLYSDLFSILGDGYGPNNSDEQVFAVPDFRGMLRLTLDGRPGSTYIGGRDGSLAAPIAFVPNIGTEPITWLVKARL
jgi:hypothetical protein